MTILDNLNNLIVILCIVEVFRLGITLIPLYLAIKEKKKKKGVENIMLPPGQKLERIDWTDQYLMVYTKVMEPGDRLEQYTFAKPEGITFQIKECRYPKN